MNSKQKGKRGELELARKLREYGYETRRGQQYSGIEGEDVVGLPHIHIECKRTERLNIYEAMKQAIKDAKLDEKPAVFWRKNREGWLVIMRFDDWVELYREWESSLWLKERGYCDDATAKKTD